MSYRFFQNRECEYFPCHKVKETDSFNCLFCYCPLYSRMDCGGKYVMLEGGIKDCSSCLLPHYNYDYILKKLGEKPGENRYIANELGIGYRMNVDSE